jgi:hypothetical protein
MPLLSNPFNFFTMLIVRKTISMEEKLSITLDIKSIWATCISLMKKTGLSVLTPNMIYKNHHVTELNKHWHKLVMVVVGEKRERESKAEKLEEIKTNG